MDLKFDIQVSKKAYPQWTSRMTKGDYNRALRDYRKAPRAYFWPRGESVMDNLMNRRARPYSEFKKALPDVSEALGLPRDTKWRWSQYAGCSCPCSPGFICEDVMVRADAHVDVLDASCQQGDAMKALIETL